MRQQSCTYEIDYGTRDFAILAVLFKAHKIVYACACLVPHPFWPDQLKIASAGPVYGYTGHNRQADLHVDLTTFSLGRQ